MIIQYDIKLRLCTPCLLMMTNVMVSMTTNVMLSTWDAGLSLHNTSVGGAPAQSVDHLSAVEKLKVCAQGVRFVHATILKTPSP